MIPASKFLGLNRVQSHGEMGDKPVNLVRGHKYIKEPSYLNHGMRTTLIAECSSPLIVSGKSRYVPFWQGTDLFHMRRLSGDSSAFGLMAHLSSPFD